jgi:hypothetical protein
MLAVNNYYAYQKIIFGVIKKASTRFISINQLC